MREGADMYINYSQRMIARQEKYEKVVTRA